MNGRVIRATLVRDIAPTAEADMPLSSLKTLPAATDIFLVPTRRVGTSTNPILLANIAREGVAL